MKGWINGVTLFMRYFSYICVWFAFVMALMSFDIPTHGFGWVMYVIGVVCISSYMTIRVMTLNGDLHPAYYSKLSKESETEAIISPIV